MTKAYEKIKSMLTASGIPFRYRAFTEDTVPPMPFLIYQFTYSENFGADGEVYALLSHFEVVLFTKLKDLKAEEQLEAALSSVYWEKEEEYLENEDCYQITYSIIMEES